MVGLDFFRVLLEQRAGSDTFVSFIFDNALAIVHLDRDEAGGRQSFNPVASMFKQFELIYVVGEERDLVCVRAIHRREWVYLYQP